MTALVAGAVAPTPAPAGSAAFGLRIFTGLLGVLLAVLVSGFNENVTKVAMPDIRGAMGIGYDESTWLLAVYSATSISAMAFAPWCAATFSLRRFTLWAIGAFLLLGILCPLAPNVDALMLLRTLQGFAGGALPPMLMSVALRFLPPGIRLYGLGSYALTATFGPSFGTPLSAWWVEYAGWQWAFWQIIPLGLLSMACVAWGLPQDPLRLERFKQFDWRGLLLGLPGLIMLVLALELGQRMNWFESPMIRFFIVAGSALMVLFFINEWSHPLPFFKLQLLKIRNLSHALLTLGGVLFVLLAVIKIPSSYLAQVQGYRPLETAPVMLLVALPQLIALPLVVAVCNLRWVDCRWVLAIGLVLLALACGIGSQVTSQWNRENFYGLQAIQIIAQPMAVIPLLMLATGGLNPADGPFASAWFNTVKGFSAVAASSVLGVLTLNREHYHSTMLLDRLGNSPLVSTGTDLARRVHQQAVVLTSSDLYLYMAVLALLLMVLIPFGPTRIYAPGTPVGVVK